MNKMQRVVVRIALPAAIVLASIAGVSAHIIKGVDNPTLATAFVSSPSATADAPIKVAWGPVDTKLRVICFHVANTSPVRADDPGSPRVTAAGFELPGSPRGFTLLEPLGGEWGIVEGAQATIPGGQAVTLDFAVVTKVNSADWQLKPATPYAGIPPGQPQVRGSGTRFCVSGPFPDTLPNPVAPGEATATTVELILNGVVVHFGRVTSSGQASDLGLWDNPLRSLPLYPD